MESSTNFPGRTGRDLPVRGAIAYLPTRSEPLKERTGTTSCFCSESLVRAAELTIQSSPSTRASLYSESGLTQTLVAP